MKVSRQEARQCRCCDQLVSEEDAEGLEAHGYDEALAVWQCGECMEVYGDRDEAKACCT